MFCHKNPFKSYLSISYDDTIHAHPRTEQPQTERIRIDLYPDRDPLDDFYEVARGVIRGQQRELSARRAGKRFDRPGNDLFIEGIHPDIHLLVLDALSCVSLKLAVI
jgi:hypothetical protein